ncbi:hypothetical protein [Agarilytica rhodophyticola]|uniref:hypothetical protein n=1 Tax=Agarilytica rhodophyticola TaxID=1737490 RepID=UPI000B3461F9|nr:hypothetical protein [Agarilytica rhodophyticola]
MAINVHPNLRGGLAFVRNKVNNLQKNVALQDIVKQAKADYPVFASSANSLLKKASQFLQRFNQKFEQYASNPQSPQFSRPTAPANNPYFAANHNNSHYAQAQQRPYTAPQNQGQQYHARPNNMSSGMSGYQVHNQHAQHRPTPNNRPNIPAGQQASQPVVAQQSETTNQASPSQPRPKFKRLNMDTVMSLINEADRKKIASRLADNNCSVTLEKLTNDEGGVFIFPNKPNMPPLSAQEMRFAMSRRNAQGQMKHPVSGQTFHGREAGLLKPETVKFFIQSHGEQVHTQQPSVIPTQQPVIAHASNQMATNLPSSQVQSNTQQPANQASAVIPSSTEEENRMLQQAIDASFLEAQNATSTSSAAPITISPDQLQRFDLSGRTPEQNLSLVTKLREECPVTLETLAEDSHGVVFFGGNELQPISYTALQGLASTAQMMHPTTRQPIDLDNVRILTKAQMTNLMNAVNTQANG